MTRLPFKGDTSTFGNSQKNALRRFLSMERRLDSNIELKLEYVKFMQDYENLGHMSMVKDLDLNSPHYFIPHHYVIKPDSTTTKLRVVGPTIQNELVITLLRFRLYQYGITADITIMYRQFWLHRSDRNFQLILWREHKSQNISVYQLNTVTYGTSSAQFLATRCLHYIADNYPYRKETGKMILKRDFYVDDMISGADDLETLQAIKNETTEILDFYNLSLTKWNSNNVNITAPNVKLTDIETARDMACPLGMLWNTKEDYFCFTFQSTNIPASHTKRNILSLASSLYDPLGLITPLIIKAKILLQQLWIIGCDWDESVPQEIYTTWNKILADLHQVVLLKIPKFTRIKNSINMQVHGFSDASIRAYGCCIYLRCQDNFGNVNVHLLTSKSRVAPVKARSLPRLELCAAHLLAGCWNKIKDNLLYYINNIYFWSDSQITLHWISSHSSTLATFVGNRVADVQEWSVNAFWRHVPTDQNPADLVFRGSTVPEFL
ncbi:uncharacterized protein LOC119664538 [Teleopsis dalmanni]|uniref:uncharacterized protein LOC119664538 n=3 Tax=Teleopsis dalmanni TaxID=139649 RepID=UPI0018CFA862|nr:uncharacterized protein LOC119664538 [Teleopsis dalmanni]